MQNRKAFSVPEDDSNRKIVSMLEFRGKVYVATERGIYIVKGEEVVRLEMVEVPSTAPIGAPERPVEA